MLTIVHQQVRLSPELPAGTETHKSLKRHEIQFLVVFSFVTGITVLGDQDINPRSILLCFRQLRMKPGCKSAHCIQLLQLNEASWVM